MQTDEIIKSGRSTEKLDNRIKTNMQSQSFSLEEWIFSDQKFDQAERVLELCSGTGRQSEYIVNKAGRDAEIILSDISPESCQLLAEKYKENKNITIIEQDIDDLLSSDIGMFDYVFVSYALYYSRLNEHTLCSKLVDKINSGGKLVVAGPYRNNNSELFGFLESYGVSLPRSVSYCCDRFMDNLLYEMTPYVKSANLSFADNCQVWESDEKLFKYWENTTFFDSKLARAVKNGLKQFFKDNDVFRVTKKLSKFDFTIK